MLLRHIAIVTMYTLRSFHCGISENMSFFFLQFVFVTFYNRFKQIGLRIQGFFYCHYTLTSS